MEINHSIHASSSSRSNSSSKLSKNILPDEIIIEILSLLPVISLLRFRSVCKAWLSEISNPNFTQLHLNRSPSCLIFHTSGAGHMYKLPLRHLLDPFKENAVVFDQSPLPLRYIVGSANGIFCLGGGLDGRYGQEPVPTCFWNPATKQCKKLPPPSRPRHRYVYASVGFGFDSVSSDYKVLRMGWKRTTPVVEVYSSNTDSWREITKIWIKLSCEEYGGVYPCCRATVKGVQYWDGFKEPRCIVTFDMHTEVFGQIPNFPIDSDYNGRKIVVFRDSVAIVVYHNNNSIAEEFRGFSLWTMDNDDFGSWTNKFSFDTFPGLPVWFLKTGEILATRPFFQTVWHLFLYDPRTKKSNIVYTPEWFDTEIDYTESLVSFKGSKQLV